MKLTMMKKILLSAIGVLVVAGAVLGVHIYQVTKLKPADPNAIAIARIDFKKPITAENASMYYTWFKAQKGINRIQFNTESNNAVLAFYPSQVNATQLVDSFIKTFHVEANRYLPSKQELMQGCPVAFND